MYVLAQKEGMAHAEASQRATSFFSDFEWHLECAALERAEVLPSIGRMLNHDNEGVVSQAVLFLLRCSVEEGAPFLPAIAELQLPTAMRHIRESESIQSAVQRLVESCSETEQIAIVSNRTVLLHSRLKV